MQDLGLRLRLSSSHSLTVAYVSPQAKADLRLGSVKQVHVQYKAQHSRSRCTQANGEVVAAHQSFLRVISLLRWGLPLPATALVQPLLEAGRGICIQGMLKQVGPVLGGPPMPPPLA